MSAPQVLVGMDGSMAQRDVALRPTDDYWHGSTDTLGSTGLVERLQAVQLTLVGPEATGGLGSGRGRPARDGGESLSRTGFGQSDGAGGHDREPRGTGAGARSGGGAADPAGPADALAPTSAAALGRTSPSADGFPVEPSGHPGPHDRGGAPIGPHRG
jgi:hypothetical protein